MKNIKHWAFAGIQVTVLEMGKYRVKWSDGKGRNKPITVHYDRARDMIETAYEAAAEFVQQYNAWVKAQVPEGFEPTPLVMSARPAVSTKDGWIFIVL